LLESFACEGDSGLAGPLVAFDAFLQLGGIASLMLHVHESRGLC